MTDRGISRLLDYLRRQAPPAADLVPDGVLLGKYADVRDEPAFELLVRRHGPLVWSAVRRILRDEHACEDALQATFLALARKAGSLRGSTSVAGWLYRVAVRVALRARPKARPMLPMPEADGDPAIAIERRELIAVVDEEVNRLPERLRAAIVLCCFSGHSTEEAAQRLGCPRGTILSRLSAAREKLRQQLARRGFEAASVGPLLAECGPAPLTSSLIAVALRAAGPATALSPFAITLAQGALTAMLMTKVKFTAIVLIAAAGLGIGANRWAGAMSGEPQAAKEKPAAAKATAEDSKAMEAFRQVQELELKNREVARREEQERLPKAETLELKNREVARREEQERLAKAETRLWAVMNEEENERTKLREQLFELREVENWKRHLDIVSELEKPFITKIFSYAAERIVADNEVEGLVKAKAEEKTISVGKENVAKLQNSIEGMVRYRKAFEELRHNVQTNIAHDSRKRSQIEAQIKRSELREALELEKYRKLLK